MAQIVPSSEVERASASRPAMQLPTWAERTEPSFAEFRDADMFARVLATTDGTVTEILEAWAEEPVAVGELAQHEAPLGQALEMLDAAEGTPVLRRDVLLVGKRSGRGLLYAESLIAVERLPAPIVAGLREGHTPIGKLLRASHLETYREILRIGADVTGPLASRFGQRASEMLVSRTYRIFAGARPVMAINERFPAVMIWDYPNERAADRGARSARRDASRGIRS